MSRSEHAEPRRAERGKRRHNRQHLVPSLPCAAAPAVSDMSRRSSLLACSSVVRRLEETRMRPSTCVLALLAFACERTPVRDMEPTAKVIADESEPKPPARTG